MKTVMSIENLEIEGMQTRECVNDAVVRDYAKEMSDGVVFDPPVVFFDGTRHYLADGFHRIAALKRRGEVEVAVDVREGTRTDALRFALAANAKHGLKRTTSDIRRCLEVAWENRVELFGGEPSYEVLARACAVSKRTVVRFFNRRNESIGDSVTNSETEVAGDQSIGDTVTNSESATLVSTDGKKRKSLKGTRSRKSAEPVTPDVVRKTPPKFKNEVFKTTALDIAKRAGNALLFEKVDIETLPEISPYSGRTREQIEKGLDRYNVPIPKAISEAFDESNLRLYDRLAQDINHAMNMFSDYGGNMVFRPLVYDRDGEYDEMELFPGDLHSACISLELGRPHCVCPECAGSRKIDGEMCDTCHGHGFVTLADYHMWITNKINRGDDEEWAALKSSLYFVPFEELAKKVQKLRERAWVHANKMPYGTHMPKDGSFPESMLTEVGQARCGGDSTLTDEKDPFADEPTAEEQIETPTVAQAKEPDPWEVDPYDAEPNQVGESPNATTGDIMDEMEDVPF